MEFEPKEKVQCPRKYEISFKKNVFTVIFVIVLAFLIWSYLVIVMIIIIVIIVYIVVHTLYKWSQLQVMLS